MANIKPLIQDQANITKLLSSDTLEVAAGIISSSGQNLDLKSSTSIITIPSTDKIIIGNQLLLDQTSIDRNSSGTFSIGSVNATGIDFGNSLAIINLKSNIVPSVDSTITIGSNTKRLFNIDSANITLRDDITDTNKSYLAYNSWSFSDDLSLQSLSTGNKLTINSTNITIQAGTTLNATSTGNFDLPNNSNARFKIEGVAVGSSVLADALSTLTNGSFTDYYHLHGPTGFQAQAGESFIAGQILGIQDDGGAPKLFMANADTAVATTNRQVAIGFAGVSAVADDIIFVQTGGEISLQDSCFTFTPTTSDVGKVLYLAEAEGRLTDTKPITNGNRLQQVASITEASVPDKTKIIIRLGPSDIINP